MGVSCVFYTASGFAVFLLFHAYLFPGVAGESLVHYLLESEDIQSNLRAAREIAELERAQMALLTSLLPTATILLPTDEAWAAHPLWLDLVKSDTGMRHRLLQTGIAVRSMPLKIDRDHKLPTLKAFTHSYVMLYDDPALTERTLCLLKSRQPLELGKCARATGPIMFESAEVYFIDDFMLRDELLAEVESRAFAFGNGLKDSVNIESRTL